jgi:hypothetical protein
MQAWALHPLVAPVEVQTVTAPSLVTRLLIETDQMLGDILTPSDCHACATRYHHAAHRLNEVLPGYPSTTPGNGSPGAGRGGTNSTVAERVDLGSERGLVLLVELQAGPQRIVVHSALLFMSVASYSKLIDPSHPILRLDAAHGRVQQILRVRGLLDRCTVGHTRNLHRPVTDLWNIVNRWGTDPPKPTPWRTDSLADDPTEMWCTSCLRIGVKEPRWRSASCKWCYEFHLGEEFWPPPEILRARAAGKRVTEQMVAPHRQRYRDRQARRRRRRR